MPSKIHPDDSLHSLVSNAKRVLIFGIGGGGDVIQAIPVANHLRRLGVETFYIGGVSCSWWTPLGEAVSADPSSSVLGPTIYEVEKLAPAEHLAAGVVGVSTASEIAGRQPAEAILADLLPGRPFVASVRGGAVGLRDGLRETIEKNGIDLVIGVDIGSDAFHDGHEVSKAHTSLVDFISLAALIQLDVPVLYGMAGYGCDGEMQLEELDARVSRVMAAGGYIDAIGLTRRDVREMLHASELYPDPVEPMAPLAARGEFGLRCVNTHGPWGTVIRVTPVAAVILFFDPHVMVEEACTGVKALVGTTSLEEAETIFREELGELPETQLEPMIRFFKLPTP